MSAEYHAEYV